MALFIAQGSFGSFWSLVGNSGPIAQMVLLILLFFSLFSWGIIFQKVRFYKEVGRQSEAFYDRFRRTSSLSELYSKCERFPQSPLAGIFKGGYEELSHQMESPSSGDDSPQLTLNPGKL